MKNRKLILIVSLVLALTMSLGGTLAYLTDTDSEVNTMVLGNVDIEQHEYQRAKNEDGSFKKGTVEEPASYVLEDFDQNKPLLPTTEVDENGKPVNWGAGNWDETTVLMSQVDSYGDVKVFKSPLAVDKFVTVENTGKTAAYVRTFIAFESGAKDYDAWEALVGINCNLKVWKMTEIGIVEINGNNYNVKEFVYLGSEGVRHENGILPAGETTYPSLSQIYLDSRADNEDMVEFDGNANGTFDILVLSQAIQAAGWTAMDDKIAAKVALDTGFGEATEANVKAWFEQVPVAEDEIDTSWYDKDAVEFVLTTAEELHGFAKLVNEEGVSFKGKTVKLGANINLANQKWTPIGQTGNAVGDFLGVFDGQGYTISNLYVENVNETNEYYASGLFGWLFNATVKNVNINGAKVAGNAYVGVIAGYLEWEGSTITNCNVVGATVIGKHVDGTNCGDKVGVIVGFAGNAGTKVEKCTAKNCSVVAGRDAGQIAGAAKQDNIVDCTATNVSVTAGGDCPDEANINEAVIGRVL